MPKPGWQRVWSPSEDTEGGARKSEQQNLRYLVPGVGGWMATASLKRNGPAKAPDWAWLRWERLKRAIPESANQFLEVRPQVLSSPELPSPGKRPLLQLLEPPFPGAKGRLTTFLGYLLTSVSSEHKSHFSWSKPELIFLNMEQGPASPHLTLSSWQLHYSLD